MLENKFRIQEYNSLKNKLKQLKKDLNFDFKIEKDSKNLFLTGAVGGLYLLGRYFANEMGVGPEIDFYAPISSAWDVIDVIAKGTSILYGAVGGTMYTGAIAIRLTDQNKIKKTKKTLRHRYSHKFIDDNGNGLKIE